MWGGQPEIMERNIRGNFVFKRFGNDHRQRHRLFVDVLFRPADYDRICGGCRGFTYGFVEYGGMFCGIIYDFSNDLSETEA